MLYLFLVFPVAGILLFKICPDIYKKAQTENPLAKPSEIPAPSESNSILKIGSPVDSNRVQLYKDSSLQISLTLPGQKGNNQDNVDNQQGRSQMGDTMGLLIRLLVVSFILGLPSICLSGNIST